MPTAAVVIIGDEILSGKFPDENGPYLVGRMRALGCDLRRLAVVGDTLDAIGDEVARCAAVHDHVVTTGGVGPTHDDLTLEGVARAFGLGTELRPELVALLDRFGLARTPTNLRMATMPVGAELILAERASFPIVRVRNVWVFPGVPRLMRAKFEEIAPRFAGPLVRCVRVHVDRPETEIAGLLTEVAEVHAAAVAIGSYPREGAGEPQVIVTLESRDEQALDDAVRDLNRRLAEG